MENINTPPKGNYRTLALIFVIIFSLFFLLSLTAFIGIIIGMEKYGGEMGDTFGLILLFPLVCYSVIFLTWSARVYRVKTPKPNTNSQLLLIFLLGLVLPCLAVLNFITG